MTILATVKVLADLCLYCAAAGAVAPWFGEPVTLLWPALLCAAGSGLGSLSRERRGLRLLALALPLASLALAGSLLDVVLLMPMAAYALAVICRGRFALDYFHYYDFFFRGLAAVGALLLFSLLGMAWRQVILYGGLYALLGFFLLRQLRLGTQQGWLDKALNLAALLAAVAGGGALCLALWGLSRLNVSLWGLFSWFFYLLWYLFQALIALGAWLAQILPGVSLFGGETKLPDLDLPPYHFDPGSGEPSSPVGKWVLALVLGAALAVAAVCLARRMLRLMEREQPSGGRSIQIERVALSPKARRGHIGSHRETVRSCYRKFLRLVRGRGVELRPSQTSADIQRACAPVADAEAAGELRALYLSARYDLSTEVTSRQAGEAKKLLQRLRREKTEKP